MAKDETPDPSKVDELAKAKAKEQAQEQRAQERVIENLERITDLEKSRAQQLDEINAKLKLGDDLEKGKTDAAKRYNEMYEALATRQTDNIAQIQAEMAATQELSNSRQEQIDKIVDQKEEYQAILDDLDDMIDKGVDLNEEQKKQYDRLKDITAELEEQEKLYKKRKKATDEHKKQLEALAAGRDRIGKAVNKQLSRMGIGMMTYEDTVLGAIEGAGGFSGALTEIGQTISKLTEPLNLVANLTSKVFESTQQMVVMYDQSQASFNKASGAAGEYNTVIEETQAATVHLGADFNQASAAIQSLHSQMTEFTKMTEQTQIEMASTTVALGRMGVDAGTAAGMFDSLTKSLGMSGAEAEKTAREAVGLAQELGVPVSKMTKDMKSAMPTLAQYGKKGVKVFKELAAAAKATGIEVSALLDLAAKFDTFEDAAESVGRLNGILGGNYLNSLEMVNMTEQERVRALIAGMQASGKSWEALDRFERKAIAASIGISDMNEANKLLGQNLDEYDAMQNKADANAASQEEMAKTAEAATSMGEKLTAMFQSLAVAVKPIVDAFHWILDGLLAINEATGNFLVPTLFGLIAVYGLLRKGAVLWAVISGKAAADKAAEAVLLQRNVVATEQLAIAQMHLARSQGLVTAQGPAVAGSMITTGGAAGAAAAPTAAFGGSLALIAFSAVLIVGALFGIIFALYKFLELIFENVAALPQLAWGILVVGAAIGTLAIGFSLLVGIAPMAFASMALIGAGLILIGLGALMAGIGFQMLTQTAGGDMIDVALGLLGFAAALMIAAPMLLKAGLVFLIAAVPLGVGALILGLGLMSLGAGMDAVGDDIATRLISLSVGLLAAGFMLALAAIPFVFGATLVGAGALVLGLGLQALGAGLDAYAPYTETFGQIIDSLDVFGLWSLIWGAVFLAGSILFGTGALVLGMGLWALGNGLDAMVGKGPILAEITDLLSGFAWSLFWSSILLFPAALLFGPAAMLIGWGLESLGAGLQQMAGMGNIMIGIGEAIGDFAWSLFWAALPLFFASIFVAPALLILGGALQEFGLGLQAMAGMGNVMIGIGEAIGDFASSMLDAAFPLWLASLFVGPALFELGWGLQEFGKGIGSMAGLGNVMIGFGEAIYGFAWELYKAAPLIDEAEDEIGDDLEDLGNGLVVFAQGIGGMAGLGNVMVGFGEAIYGFALELEKAADPIDEAEDEIGDDLEDLGNGLIVFAQGIAGMAGLGNVMVGFGQSIHAFAVELLKAADPIDEAEDEIGDDLEDLGNGLIVFAQGIAGMAGLGNVMVGFGQSIYDFAKELLFAAPLLDEAEDEIGDDLEDIGDGLMRFGNGIAKLAGLGNVMVGFGESIFDFALGLLMAAPMLDEAEDEIGDDLEDIGDALNWFGLGLNSLVGQGNVMVGFTNAIVPFAFNLLLATGMLKEAAWPFWLAALGLNWGMEELSEAFEWVSPEDLFMYGIGFHILGLGAEKLAEVGVQAGEALQSISQGIEDLADLSWWEIHEAEHAIWHMGWALERLSRGKRIEAALALAYVLEELNEAAEIEPEDVETLRNFMDVLQLDTGDEEALASQADLASAMNNLAEAIREASSSEGKDKKGQDIYLVMDKAGTQKIAKATGVELNKMHNTLLKTT